MTFLKLIFCLCVLCFTHASSFGQKTLWASKVLGYSSEHRPDSYGYAYRARQILGEPNKLPTFGNSPCAWSPADFESRNEEWIKVGFAESMTASQIAVGENFNPGAIARVYVYNDAGKEFLVYENRPEKTAVRGRMLNILLPEKIQGANAVKVILQPDKVPGANQLDAIAMADHQSLVVAHINLAGDLPKDLVKENLGKNINTKGQEINPIISQDGKTLYFTRSSYMENTGTLSKQDVWFSKLSDRGNWGKAVNIGEPINNPGNNAVVSVSSDQKTLYLINHYRPGGTMFFGLSKSAFTSSGWSFPQDLKIKDLYNDQQDGMDVTISANENVMILSVQRRDTEGDKDLYVSFLQPDQSWTEPLHMGKTINTADYEGTPFLALDNRTLYFASKGHSGYGGSDIFISRRLDDSWTNWSKPANLGPLVNTPQWDMYFNIPASGDYAYFNSSENSLGSEDIFRLTLPPLLKPEPVAIIAGSVLSAETNKPINAALVVDLKKNNEVFSKMNFDLSKGNYQLTLPVKELYRITASEKGYFSTTEEVDLTTESDFRTIALNLILQPLKVGQQIRLSNTMFLQSSSEVSKTAFPQLDRIVETLKEYPTMEILLEGHTDNQGEVAKNVKLSEERVIEVKKYLLTKGIEDKRIQTKAWGPAKPIASNATEQSRQRNRRVEFTILKM